MGVFILIIVITGGYGSATDSVEMSTKDACESAALAVQKRQDELFRSRVTAVCVEKYK